MKAGVLEMLPSPVRRMVPPRVKWEVRRQVSRWHSRTTARCLRAARDQEPLVLDLNDLEALQGHYAPPKTPRYTADALASRGSERAAFLQQIATMVADAQGIRSLEIGCLDGMVSGLLQQSGWRATGIDLEVRGFDPRALEAGAKLLATKAEALALNDDSFDLVYSYDAFEHLEDPQQALQEMIRVTAPGGLIYLNFGPLYNSAFGLHAYRSVHVPFCQFLFSPQTLDAYCHRHNLPPIKYHQLNRWSLGRYRSLWRSCGDRLERLRYLESWSLTGKELIERHPRCFASAVDGLEELAVGHIEVLFRVRKR